MEAASLFWLAAKAVAIAALPLAYVLLSNDRRRYRRLAWITAFLTLDLVMFGSFTRLTDSGLGCPDWPGCYGHSNPLSAGEHIRAAETALPSGPVTMTKAWIEMVHRYFAMAVGFLIIVLATLAWVRRRRGGEGSPWLATAALAAVCLQGAFGALTVTMKLQPAIVTAHLLGGIGLLALLVWLASREESPAAAVDARAASYRGLAAVGAVLLVVQIALGGWVSTNYAVLACPDFPLCHGRVFPGDMDFAAGFAPWRDLGMMADGQPIPFQALVAIHWTHRNFAFVVFAVLGVLAWRLWPLAGVSRLARALAGVLALQFVTGLSNVVFEWPLLLAVAHNGGAAMLAALLVMIGHRISLASSSASGPRQMPVSAARAG